jgi:hypothetical protein
MEHTSHNAFGVRRIISCTFPKLQKFHYSFVHRKQINEVVLCPGYPFQPSFSTQTDDGEENNEYLI